MPVMHIMHWPETVISKLELPPAAARDAPFFVLYNISYFMHHHNVDTTGFYNTGCLFQVSYEKLVCLRKFNERNEDGKIYHHRLVSRPRRQMCAACPLRVC